MTVIEEPSNQFVDFFKVSNETGQELADGIWNNVILPTNSEKSLLAIGTGEFSNGFLPAGLSLERVQRVHLHPPIFGNGC